MTYALRREGFTVATAMDGQQALQRWEAERPDIILLDGNLPKVDGFEVCRRIRHASEDADHHAHRPGRGGGRPARAAGGRGRLRHQALQRQAAHRPDAGVLRRYQDGPTARPGREVEVGDITLDLQSHEVTKGGEPVQLTPLEFRILYLLAMNEGRVVPYSRLVEYAWGYYDEGNSSLLKTHLSHIRKKLAPPCDGPRQRQGRPRRRLFARPGLRVRRRGGLPLQEARRRGAS